ncbi:MAG: methylmalonyl Co-A mutase-associated GTPase MeaB, partial [Flavobacteriales bacterium]|nr:methylmalonyl Co-A mutase-associated GTPase MeaB [Flavobacteriales bacterium]
MADSIDIAEYKKGLQNGVLKYISKSISLVESKLPEHKAYAHELLKHCIELNRQSKKIGITGPPGVGKSTFIEVLGESFLQDDKKIAVLAIDPSSVQGGSILGDKTRMTKLSSHPSAFVRPSPSEGIFGGVAPKTYQVVRLLEAAGFDYIIIETVGVGQSEYILSQLVDVFVLLTLANSGVYLQGIKRGFMEMTFFIFLNKSYTSDERSIKKKIRDLRNTRN